MLLLTLACAHGRGGLTTDDQVVAGALAFAVRVPSSVPVYKVELPRNANGRRVEAIAAREAGLQARQPGVLFRGRATADAAAVRIEVREPEWLTEGGERQARVRFTYTTPAGALVDCVVRIKVLGGRLSAWEYRPEGGENCWPAPGNR